MKAIESPDVAKLYLKKMRDKVDVPRARTEMHCSDLELCPVKVWYRRTLSPKQYPLSDKSILFFASGIAWEAWMGAGHKYCVKDGIHCNVDDETPLGLTEMKSTRIWTSTYNPTKSCPWWIFRCKSYAYAFGEKHVNLVVFFWVGNGRDERIDLKAWRVEFESNELEEHWAEVLRRKAILLTALETGEPIDVRLIWTEAWECRSCNFRDICYAREVVEKK